MNVGKTGAMGPDGDRGATLVFDIDQENEKLEVRWSVCNGSDTFDKKRGINEALKREPIKLNYNREMTLTDNLRLMFVEMIQDNISIPFEQRPLINMIVDADMRMV